MLEFQVEITKGCHLECLHCSTDARMLKDGFRFNFEALSAFISQINEKRFVYLSGGEPLLVPELSTQIGKLSSSGLTVGLYSSGIVRRGKDFQSVPLNEATLLKRAGLSECYFSVYDMVPSGHDAITMVSGSLDLTLESIRNFIAVGGDAKVHLVLNKYLINHIESAIDFFLCIGVKEVRLLSLVKSGRALDNWGKIGVNPLSQMEKMKSLFDNYSTLDGKVTFSGMPEHIACRPLNKDIGCVAGRKLFYITYEGEIFPCAGTRNRPEYSLGNIEHNEFGNIRIFRSAENSCVNRGSNSWDSFDHKKVTGIVKIEPS